MTIFAASAVSMLVQALATRDTVLMRALPPVRTPVEQFFFVMSGTGSVLLVVLLLLLIVAVFMAWRAAVAAGRRMDELLDDLRPMLAQATAVSESVARTADLLQKDVALVSTGVEETSARVKHSVAKLADRVEDFNDLLGKVHARADTVVDVGGAAIDGIGAVVKRLRGKKRGFRLRK
ncbi:MAG: hypothetical protein ACHQQ3_13380 [Gemmatimonadales bacterium]